MIITLKVLLVTRAYVIIASSNPIKTRFYILISARIIFLLLKLNTGSTWMPLIFFILFAGGILVIFIILASVLPNEKIFKLKFNKVRVTMLILILLLTQRNNKYLTISRSQIKSFLTCSLNITLIITLILIYFFYSINLNTKEEYSIRSLQCW